MKPLLARWLVLPLPEKSRILESAATLLQVRVIFGFVPFARALRLLRIEQGEATYGRIAVTEATEIARAISRASGQVPFRALCLQQAFAALLMLRRRGIVATVRMGARRDSEFKHLSAHAWCCSDTVPVTGFPIADDFVSLVTFRA